jgi:hypothetical protein
MGLLQNLEEIFEEIKKELKKFSPPLVERKTETNKKQYHLWSEKDIEIAGRKRSEVYFAGIIIQKNYVGFYYMPVYTDKEAKNFFPAELLKLKKGKSCFYIKEKGYGEQVEMVLKEGFELYQKRGWV